MKLSTTTWLAATALLLVTSGYAALGSAQNYDAFDPKKPLLNATWPVGIQVLVNIKERTGGQSINAIQNFHYSGTAKSLNAFLKRYSGFGHKSVYLGTVEESMGVKEVGYDWKMQVDGYSQNVSLLVSLHGHIRPGDIQIPAGMDVDTFEPSNPDVQSVLKHYQAKSRP